PWLSFDETVISTALAEQGSEDEDLSDDDEAPMPTNKAKGRKATNSTATAARAPSGNRLQAGIGQRARMNQSGFYQAFQSFERLRLIRRLGLDDRQRPEEQFRLDE